MKHLWLTHQSGFRYRKRQKYLHQLNRIINCFWYEHLLPEYIHSIHDLITIRYLIPAFMRQFFSSLFSVCVSLSNSYGSWVVHLNCRKEWEKIDSIDCQANFNGCIKSMTSFDGLIVFIFHGHRRKKNNNNWKR